LAEATLLVSGRHWIRDATDDEVVACGTVAEVHGEICIVSLETGLAVPEGSAGELCVRNNSVTTGYWNRPNDTGEMFHQYDGGPRFLRTGDIGAIHNGELLITGRTKELIIIRGRNYCPQDIEEVVETSHLSLSPHACAVFACDGEDGEGLVAVQEVRRDQVSKLPVNEVMDAIRRAVVEEFELRPRAIVLVRPATLPKTLNGKIMRLACREAFEARRLDVVAQWSAAVVASQPVKLTLPASTQGSSKDELQSWLISRLAQELGISTDEIDPSKPLANYGLDSLQQASFIGEISESLGYAFSPALFTEYQDVESLAAYLSAVQDISARLENLQPDQRRSLLLSLADAKNTCAFASTDEIPERCYRFEAFPEVQELAARASKLLSSDLPNPFFTVSSGGAGARALINGTEFINYSSNNYLGLSEHPEVISAAKDALDQYGTSVSASRIVSGERLVHRELERALAAFVGADDCLTFVGGNTANVTTIGHLFGERDLVLYDERSHDSVLKGILLAQADSYAFRHNSWEDVERLLASKRALYQKVLVFIEGIYSMDGDIPDLPRFIEVKKRHKAILMVDECLSIGVLGKRGRGVGEHFAIDSNEVDIWMGTISKALASCGGYIAGSHALVDYLRYTAPGFVFTTGISPANTAAALAALKVLEREPWRVDRVRQMASTFLQRARELGFDTGTSNGTPAIPIFIRDPNACLLLYKHLFEHRINVQPIFYPAVPADASRLRFFVTCSHTEDDIDYTLKTLAEGKVKLDRQVLVHSA
jgi:8-amino-7-oxononanoate synthase